MSFCFLSIDFVSSIYSYETEQSIQNNIPKFMFTSKCNTSANVKPCTSECATSFQLRYGQQACHFIKCVFKTHFNQIFISFFYKWDEALLCIKIQLLLRSI